MDEVSETMELPVIDKSDWPDGPWKSEPDRVQWQHAGYTCLVIRQPRLGNLCGYVGVGSEHPLYGRSYREAEEDLAVHGGLTYSDKCSGSICHLPEPGMPEDVWWFGFDCAHLFDLVPNIFGMDNVKKPLPGSLAEIEARRMLRDVYRDIEYVKAQTESLAEQLRAVTVSSKHGKQSNN